MAIAKDGHARPGDAVFTREFDGELVVLDLAGGEYYGLNEVGARVWQRLVDGASPAQIAEDVAREFDVDATRALADVQALLAELEQRKLIVPTA